MLHKIHALSLAAVAAFALAPGLAAAATPNCAAANTSGSLNVVGLTSDSRLICFNEFAPASAVTIGFTYGLTGGDYRLVGIDFRVQDGGLYGVGNAGGVYRLSLTDGTATFVNRLSVALSGSNFGVDFNPAADRLRIISDNGQNLRHNINAGGVTLTDGALNYVAGTATNGVTGAAYTNNDLVALTATTLFDLDAELDQVALQSPPNNGTLVATGKLGVNASYVAGFDIYSQLSSGGTVGNFALAAFRSPASPGQTAVYSVNVLTGATTLRGSLSTDNDVYDIAIPLNQF
ncbi:MAG: DUF4394 domain-containing protein [Pseudomonadota bacterium]